MQISPILETTLGSWEKDLSPMMELEPFNLKSRTGTVLRFTPINLRWLAVSVINSLYLTLKIFLSLEYKFPKNSLVDKSLFRKFVSLLTLPPSWSNKIGYFVSLNIFLMWLVNFFVCFFI